MNKKILMVFIFSFFLLTLVSSAPPFQQGTATSGIQIETAIFQSIKANQPFEFYIHAFNKTDGVIIPNTDLNCTLELINSSGVHTLNVNMTPRINGIDMEYEANSTEIKEGSYVTFIYCHLISEPTIGDFINYNFDITITGDTDSPQSLNSLIFITLLFILLGYLFYYIRNETNFNKKYKKLINDYRENNYIRFIFASLWYNIIKNIWVIYYLIGLIILTLSYDIVLLFNVDIVMRLIKVILGIYTWMSIAVGMVFFGYIQEFFIKMKDLIKDENWGIVQ